MRVTRIGFAAGIVFVGALGLTACSSTGDGPSTGAGGSTAGSSAAGSGAGTGGGGSGTAGTGAAGTGAAGTGAAGTGAAGTGTAGTGAAGTGAAGTGSAGTGAAGTGAVVRPTGRSAGCDKAPPINDKATGFTVHPLTVPGCGAGAVTPKCVASAFAPGGALAQTNGAYDFLHRNYAVQLPTNYDPAKAYPVIIGGGGCGGGPTESGGGFTAGQGGGDAIRIGLSYVKMCFADGGNSCAGTAANQPQCVNTPEVPFFYAALADIEAKYCVDRAKVFVGGYSSGGWETFTLGCAAADVIRGIVTVNGGLRNHRPACTGPIPALMVVGEADHDNPVGPLVMDTAYAPAALSAAEVNMAITSLDSNGSAPARDAILARNGCVGTDTAVFDPAFPLCKKYTGCPAASPVVWCPVTGAGHGNLSYQGANYYPGPLLWSFLTKVP